MLALLPAGLWVDREFDLPGQVAASVCAWALFLFCAARAPVAERRLLLKCLLVATVGELLCSLAWRLYEYRLLNVPAFVPPGHVLLLMAGERLSAGWSARRTRVVGGACAACMAVAAVWLHDTFSIAALLLLAVLWRGCPAQRPVFAAMLPLALLLEVVGTGWGNWAWKAEVPGLGLATLNPPLAASVFYCVLDAVVLHVRRERLRAWILAWRPSQG